ncbi:GNAT family protein [Pasteurella canis]|uniref:GNAT family N-acetyltransferase n=1 Tax=Pasteurella canis TaxID=753 RepID=UPI00132368E4|nr:GNAT family N-acetyltransferase [Pasteurella canis]MXN88569.1 N-acetyltransferase [Pasteurella canis]
MDNLKVVLFSDVNLDDPFFDSLKKDYKEFSNWFRRKSNERAYVLYNDNNLIEGFLYYKFESDVEDVNPPIRGKSVMKVGTFKFNPAGTLRGQRFIKKILDIAVTNHVDIVYLTVFEKHEPLIKLFKFYGFEKNGEKVSQNGTELVYLRDLHVFKNHIYQDYPFIHQQNANKYLLAIKPEYHTRMFPESKLFGESPDIIKDVSHSNSIHKIYISAAYGANNLRRGDILVMYRMTDIAKRAYYRSVLSSVCVVESVRHVSEFKTLSEYLKYCLKFSVFTEQELSCFYYEKYPEYVIRFTYNLVLPKRINRQSLLDNGIIQGKNRIVLHPISDEKFNKIIYLSKANESFIID